MRVKIFWFGIKFTFLYDSRKLNFAVILAKEKNRNASF
jgi:hypothetical protein